MFRLIKSSHLVLIFSFRFYFFSQIHWNCIFLAPQQFLYNTEIPRNKKKKKRHRKMKKIQCWRFLPPLTLYVYNVTVKPKVFPMNVKLKEKLYEWFSFSGSNEEERRIKIQIKIKRKTTWKEFPSNRRSRIDAKKKNTLKMKEKKLKIRNSSFPPAKVNVPFAMLHVLQRMTLKQIE